MWKKIIALEMLFLICLSLFCGCKQNGEFVWLHEAYEQQWISKEDLKNIAFNYNSKHYKWSVDYGSDFSPSGVPSGELSDGVRKSTKQAFCRKNKISINLYSEVTISSEYYGFFNGCYIVDLSTSCIVGGDPVIFEEYELGGVKFYNYHYIGVYKEG